MFWSFLDFIVSTIVFLLIIVIYFFTLVFLFNTFGIIVAGIFLFVSLMIAASIVGWDKIPIIFDFW